MDIEEAKKRFQWQKSHAKARGIEWRLTFEQWLEWWGDDLDRRGTRRSELSMQRPADRGAYELGNIRKGAPADNARTRAAMYIKPQAVFARSERAKGMRTMVEMEHSSGYASAWDLYG